MRRLMILFGVIAFGATTAMAGVILVEIPVEEGQTFGQATSMTPDGAYIGCQQGLGSDYLGYIWNADIGIRRILAGGYDTTASGIAYRTPPSGPVEIVVHGYNAGWCSMNATTDEGLTWDKRRWINYPNKKGVNIGANMTMQGDGGELLYGAVWSKDSGAALCVGEMSGTGSVQWDSKGTPNGTKSTLYGCSATGLGVGRRKGTTGYRNYKAQFDGDGGLSATYFYGLHEINVLDGQAWSVSADGSKVGGVSPVSDGRDGNWPYLSDTTPGGAVELPTYPDTAGSSSNGWVYAVSPNGDYACGMNFRGMEKAVLWDCSDADPANWTVTDLTELADGLGALGKFTLNLRRAYAVTVNDDGNVMVAGRGVINDPVEYRGFVLTITEPISLTMDIYPNDDPNLFTPNKKGGGRVPIEIYGSEELGLEDVNPDTIKVAGIVSPVKIQSDVDHNGDGIVDLKIHVNRRELIDAMSLDLEIGNVVEVVVTGAIVGGDPSFEATDIIEVVPLEG